jgi:hypothetical protein
MEHWGICFVVNDKTSYLIYISDNNDDKYYSFKRENNKLVSFSHLEELYLYLEYMGIHLEEDEIPIYDFDTLEENMLLFDGKIDNDLLLNYWNIIDDVSNSLEIDFIGKEEKYNKLYDKMFRGCNTPANTFEYNIIWSKEELDMIKEVMRACISISKNIV